MTVTEKEIYGDIRQNVTPVIEDYLKAIYSLREKEEQVRTVALSTHLNVKPPTATAMLKTLADLELIEYEPYHGAKLTATGEKIALEIIRHHRLIELYLVKALGFTWDEVHDEAEILEHFISERLEARIAAYLGDPTHDPHGDPIPAFDGTLPEKIVYSLADFNPPAQVSITRVCDQNAERLRYLAELGFVPGTSVKIVAVEPFDGPVTIQLGTRFTALDRKLAGSILADQKSGK
ncbi:MAG TPA: metal-dependent transcriptional regulator [Pyrinomonadaceae bacterium]|nr:metal-dependent transcriptional regulator [Pyrinomonadaceae bacterium]